MRKMLLATAVSLLLPSVAQAFCGHYVGRPGAELYSGASEVVLTRRGDRSTLTLINDYQGDLTEFAVLIPVPPGVTEADVSLAEPNLLANIRQYSAPRFVEYACDDLYSAHSRGGGCNGIGCSEVGLAEIRSPVSPLSDAGLDVTVEQEFAVGNYEIVVLSSTDAADLMTWLNNQGYGVSDTAEDVLATYIEGGSQFFAAKVGLDDPVVGSGTFLEPLQVRYKSEVLSLPIRLGTLNSPGVQDLILYVLGVQTGRVGIANYPEVQVEGECMVDAAPGEFAAFYADQLDLAFAAQDASWTTEYAWAATGCDPCPPGGAMSPDDMMALGVPQADVNDTTLTRLHMRYTAEAADEDLVLYTKGDKAFDQMRYIQYQEELEGTFPLCGSGWADKPKLCPHQRQAVQQSTVGGWLSFGFVGVLAGLGLLFRRRRR